MRERPHLYGRSKPLSTYQARVSLQRKTIQASWKQKAIRVDLLICDNTIKHAVRALTDFTNMGFGEDLDNAVEVFRQWDQESKANQFRGVFTARLTSRIGTLTMAFFDPQSEGGEAVVIPVLPETDASW